MFATEIWIYHNEYGELTNPKTIILSLFYFLCSKHLLQFTIWHLIIWYLTFWLFKNIIKSLQCMWVNHILFSLLHPRYFLFFWKVSSKIFRESLLVAFFFSIPSLKKSILKMSYINYNSVNNIYMVSKLN